MPRIFSHQIETALKYACSMKQIAVSWGPVIAYCAIIFIQSSHPSPDNFPRVPHLDKIAHVGMYAILSVLCFRALMQSLAGCRQLRIALLSVLMATLYGASDELHQYFIPYRQADTLDLVADAVGAVLGVLIWWAVIAVRTGKQPEFED